MTKADVIARISGQTGLSKVDVRDVIEGFLDMVKVSLKENDPLEIRKFGTFTVVDRAPRTARNPRTGEEVKIKARRLPVFKPSKEMKKMM